MDARFEQDGLNDLVIVLTPEDGTESLLLAAWLKYDANIVTASVKRLETKRIASIELRTGSEH